MLSQTEDDVVLIWLSSHLESRANLGSQFPCPCNSGSLAQLCLDCLPLEAIKGGVDDADGISEQQPTAEGRIDMVEKKLYFEHGLQTNNIKDDTNDNKLTKTVPDNAVAVANIVCPVSTTPVETNKDDSKVESEMNNNLAANSMVAQLFEESITNGK